MTYEELQAENEHLRFLVKDLARQHTQDLIDCGKAANTQLLRIVKEHTSQQSYKNILQSLNIAA